MGDGGWENGNRYSLFGNRESGDGEWLMEDGKSGNGAF